MNWDNMLSKSNTKQHVHSAFRCQTAQFPLKLNWGVSYLRATLRFIHIFLSTRLVSILQVSSHLDGLFPPQQSRQ